MNSRRIRLALPLVAIALLGAGCGDDDEETTTTTTGTTGATGATGQTGALLPADFIAEADAICAQGDAEIEAEAERIFGDSEAEPPEADQIDFLETVVVPNVREQLDALAGLDPPEEGAEEFDTMVDNAYSALEEIEADPQAFLDGDDPFKEVNQLASELGLEDCGG